MATDLLPPIQTPGGLPADAFTLFRNVPVFRAHRTTARNGRELVFGPEELAAVCRRCNQRIEDTGDYAAVVIGHTPGPDAQANGAAMPDQIGFAGPFRMGEMPDGTAAIFADFWIYKEDAPKLRRYPRRSPELWLEERYEDMFLDPIALLGSETPRLDLGMLLYSALRDGRQVERYAAASPGASNSFIPSEDYAADDSPNSGSHTMALSQEDVQQVVEAIMQTAPMQYVQQKMMAEQGNGQPPNAGGPPEVPEDGSEEYANSADGDELDDEGEPVQYNADGVPKPEEGTMQPKPSNGQPEQFARQGQRVNYAKLQREHRELVERYQKLEEAVNHERSLRIDTERRAELERLQNDGYMLNLDKEMSRCCYSKMNDEQFTQHIETIAECYQRCPHGAGLPEGVLPMRQPEKYSKEHAAKASRMVAEARERGQELSYEEALEKAASGAA